jgi:hypothetical protein
MPYPPAAIAAIQTVYPNFIPFMNPIPFRVARGPRPMAGQQPINLPQDIVVDYPVAPGVAPFNLQATQIPPCTGATSPPTLPCFPYQSPTWNPNNQNPAPAFRSIFVPDSQTGQLDIMFSPSGKVIRDAGNVGKIVLWVYDTSDPNGGSMSLVTVYTRTGVITAHPVNLSGSDPYSFIRDGRASGM